MQKPDSIRKIRTALGYKQETIAEYLGITQQAFSDIERSITCLDLAMAEKIAAFLQVPLTDIYYDTTTLPLPAPNTEKELLLQLLTEKDKRLSDKDKHIALLEMLVQEKQKKK